MREAGDAASKLREALGAAFPAARVTLRSQPRTGSSRADWRVRIEVDAKPLDLLIEYKRALSGARLRDAIAQIGHHDIAKGDAVWVLASDYLSPAMQGKLRDAGVPFVDFAGNAWLTHEGIHIDRRGFSNPDAETRLPRGPFSDKASLVVRALFASHGGRGVRDLAGELELTPGYVSKVLRELDRRGYLARRDDGMALRHAGDLLTDWLHAYRGRRPASARAFFAPVASAKALIESARSAGFAQWPDYALTMQSGASLVSRHAEFDTLDLYVRHAAMADRIAATLGARPAARGANLLIMVPYYRVSAFYGERRVRDLMIVSDLQLYLDLYDYPQRGREQAERIYERRILPRIRELEDAE